MDDINNLLFFDSNDSELEIVGFFPSENTTGYSKTGDLYAIGLQKGESELKDKINDLLSTNKSEIEDLKVKWFNIPNQTLLFRMRNMPHNPTKLEEFIYNWGILILAGSIVLFIGFVYLLVLGSKKRAQQLLEKIELSDLTLNEQLASFKKELSSSTLDENEIVKHGIKFFSTCQENIYYVGAGGFIGDIHSNKWRDAIYKCDKPLFRVVDLPLVEEAVNKGIFTSIECINYTKWLIMQAMQLEENHKNLQLINSRGASLWGHGFIIMIKDSEEMMLFTGGENKFGYLIKTESIVQSFSNNVKQLINRGTPIDSNHILNEYFERDPEIDQALILLSKEKTDKTILKITDICKNYLRRKHNI